MTLYDKMRKKNKAGFTLVELIVVIAILAILAAILVPLMVGYIDDANKAVAQANARTLYSAAAAAQAYALSQSPAIEVPASCSNAGTDAVSKKIISLLGADFTGTWTVTYTNNAIKATWTDANNASRTATYPATATTNP